VNIEQSRRLVRLPDVIRTRSIAVGQRQTLLTDHRRRDTAARPTHSRLGNNNNNNNIRKIGRCQNATCYSDMDRTVKKHEVTEVLDC